MPPPAVDLLDLPTHFVDLVAEQQPGALLIVFVVDVPFDGGDDVLVGHLAIAPDMHLGLGLSGGGGL